MISPTGLPGTDHRQEVYHLRCLGCGAEYGVNGSDIHLRKCPNSKKNCAFGGGRPGIESGWIDIRG